MSYNKIKKLINKYDNVYVAGEKRSLEYERQYKQKQAVKKRHMIAQNLFNEVTFHLNIHEKNQVHYLIDKFTNFKKLHRKAKNEAIILAFIFYVKLKENTLININKYKISKKYNLTNNKFEIILCKIILQLLQETEIKRTITTRYDHNILLKGEIK